MIPLVDLKAQYRTIRAEIDAAVAQVLTDCGFVKGPRVAAFEEQFAAYCGTTCAVGTSSGTTALHLALAALGVGPGDEVIVPAHTFIATVEPIVQLGARIVFADVDAATYTLDPASVERCITRRTRVILPVHLYGQMADLERLRALAAAGGRNLFIVEDAAQAHGARRGPHRAGGGGMTGCFSFFPSKNLGACGDAGAVTTDDGELAQRMRKLCDHGREDKYRHDLLGYNYRLDALQAAVLRVKLAHLDKWNRRRRSRAARYDELLRDVPGVTLPGTDPKNEHVYHLYVIQVDDRDGLCGHLAERRIAAGIHYPIALHQQPALWNIDCGSDALPVTERLVGRILSLPLFPEMTDDQVAEVADAVRTFQTRRVRRRTDGAWSRSAEVTAHS